MQYFNADGSTGSLCGNGARCAIKYAEMTNRVKSKTAVFNSNGQEYQGEILTEGSVKFFLKEPTKIKTGFRVKAHNQLIKANFADTGSPHVIINIEDVLENPKNLKSYHSDLETFPVVEVGQEIRNLPEFRPNGTNVNFIQLKNDLIKMRSFERGVEAETLACGTGAVAAAIILHILHKKNPPIKIITKSNAELIVNFEMENQRFTNLSLTGPVEIEHKGTYSF
ncbi:MAG: diaminopimelate epimerase [Melioribacteraceae bacterium]|nr:diaminopimelate epimerase [Melioribacteraceae bacterium]